MVLRFQYNKQEVINALRFHFLNRPEMKLFKIILLLMVAFAFVGYWMGVVNLQMLVWVFLLFIVLILVFWYILPYSVFRKAKTFREPAISLEWTEEGITISTQKGKSSLPWRRFQEVVETRRFFYLYSSGKSFFLIPAAAFESRDERVFFSEFLQNHFQRYTFK